MAKRGKSGCFLFLLLIAVAVFAYFTNPTKEMHQQAAKVKVEKISENLLAKYGLQEGLLGSLGMEITEPFVADLLEKHVTSKNYFLFSTTQVEWDNQSQTIGLGAFNKVFISNKVDEIIEREIEKYVKEKIESIKIPGVNLNEILQGLGL